MPERNDATVSLTTDIIFVQTNFQHSFAISLCFVLRSLFRSLVVFKKFNDGIENKIQLHRYFWMFAVVYLIIFPFLSLFSLFAVYIPSNVLDIKRCNINTTQHGKHTAYMLIIMNEPKFILAFFFATQ